VLIDKEVKMCEFEKCSICGSEVCTSEFDGDGSCPVHLDGCQLHSGAWVCSEVCWELASEKEEGK
jgi:hypothetical protein